MSNGLVNEYVNLAAISNVLAQTVSPSDPRVQMPQGTGVRPNQVGTFSARPYMHWLAAKKGTHAVDTSAWIRSSHRSSKSAVRQELEQQFKTCDPELHPVITEFLEFMDIELMDDSTGRK